MPFTKLGEAVQLSSTDIIPVETIMNDAEIYEKFAKHASILKKIAPKAEDFLYFSAVMMHAAEAAIVNPDGSPKFDRYGKVITAHWEKSNDSLKWICSDSNIKCFKNSNGDIFPESELLKAYKNWVGKPLCVDHKSSSVDAIRGIIVDTYYDHKCKRIIALCALDKVNYPDLARKVSSQYATSVSMGVGVGKAICTDCGKVARVADDFCYHMKTKSGYGEINTELQPIELSIVVNGADPQAKIKEIIASANSINRYIDIKTAELNKQEVENVEDLKKELQELSAKVFHLREDVDNIASDSMPQAGTTDAPYGTSSGSYATDELQMEPSTNLGTPPARFASDDLTSLLQTVNKNLESLSTKIDSIKNASEKNMSMKKESYFQGGGGVNEPTPGQPKYEKDPMNTDLRMNSDKQMVGQHDQNTGPVDGMHPGTDSSGMSDLERKKLLSRAEKEQRSIRRSAALTAAKENMLKTKEAYFQGGGGVNEPTPGKRKYDIDPLAVKDRDKEDKQMVGQKPFPDVGDVDGLHPSPSSVAEKDELKRKEMLGRASLKLRFVKAANTDGTDNLGDSSWHVYSNDKLVSTASVKELSGGKVEALYNSIATKEFGKQMLEKIKSVGFDKAMNIYKSAQEAPAPANDVKAPLSMPDMPEVAPAEKAMDNMGGDGDVKEDALELAEKVRDTSSDLVEAVRLLTGDQAEMESVDEMPKAASAQTKALYKSRKELSAALLNAMKHVASELSENDKELKIISNIINSGSLNESNKDSINMIVAEAMADAKESLAKGHILMGDFIKYARGAEALVKRAEAEVMYASDGEDMDMADKELDLDELLSDLDQETLDKDIENLEMKKDKQEVVDVPVDEKDMSEANDGKTVVELPAGVAVPTGAKAITTASFDLTTKEGRAAYRAKLAYDMEYNEILEEAHPKGGTTTQLDVKPEGDLAKVEDLCEKQEKMLEVAKMPPKVRKEAEQIQKLIAEGKLAASDVDDLVSYGADADAVKYWKQFYGQAGKDGSEFASELVKEHAKAKSDQELTSHKIKLSRAYQLTNEMVRKGIVADNDSAVNAQVEEVMSWNDEAFESMKKMVSKQANRKTASAIPQVGVSNGLFSEGAQPQSSNGDLYEGLVKAFATKKLF